LFFPIPGGTSKRMSLELILSGLEPFYGGRVIEVKRGVLA
jgi:hypothetical protein